ncbi:pectinesterase [Perilla frutescens var. frutescens]|nr:pectinesterase [Perilla frutescens var. frutescens]
MAWRIITIYLSTIMLCVSSQYPNKPSPYEALEQYKFPVGLLPKGATGYSLNEATGEFSAHLNGSCSFTLEKSYELRYEPVIKGLISEGRLQKLSGVSVKVALLWLNVVEVKRNHENLEFSVGFTSANFPIQNFEECPQCGCGLDCGGENGGVEENRTSS